MSEQQQENKTVQIWLRGKKLCEVPTDNEALEEFERIVIRAGLFIKEIEEGNKIIKMI